MSADNLYAPYYSYSTPASAALAEGSRPKKAGNAHLLNAVLHFGVPIFEENPVNVTTLRDLGTGGSFIVTSGNLNSKLDDRNAFFRLRGENGIHEDRGDKFWDNFKEGSTVAIKALNFDRLEDINELDMWPDLESLVTEIAVLAHPPIRSYPRIARLLGIGWEGSPYQENEERRYAPYLITEFGRRGNLTDYFRYRHRIQAEWQPLTDLSIRHLPGPSNVTQNTTIPWILKLGMSFCVVDALYMLHHYGVVHGDVKFENIVTGASKSEGVETLHWKICDFGSSILLSNAREATDNPKPYRLKSFTIPWNAPEALKPLSANDAIKTDIYSFGHVFARIMLDGNDLFDTAFHIAGTAAPKRDEKMVEWMVEEDAVYDYAISRIEGLNQYTTEQLIIIRNILSCTLRTNPSYRVACLGEIRTILYDLDQTERAGKPRMKMHEISKQFSKLTCSLCFSERDENDKEPKLVEVPEGLSKLEGITINSLGLKHGIMREVFYSLKATVSTLAEKPNASSSNASDVTRLAEATAHMALWHLHGYGIPYDFALALELFLKSADAGELRSILAAVFLSQATNMPLPRGFADNFLPKLKSKYPTSNNRLIAEVLKFLDPISYAAGLRETCSGLVDLASKERLSVTIRKPDNVKPSNKLIFRIIGKTLEVPEYFGLTKLHQACIKSSLDEIQACLKQANVDVNCVTVLRHTPLWIACSSGNLEAVKILLEAGANPTITDVLEGLSPLHFLSRFDVADVPLVGRLLLKHGGDPNCISKSKETPIMFILDFLRDFRAGSVGVAVSTLLDLGASPVGPTTGVPEPPFPRSSLKSVLESSNYSIFYPMYDALCGLELQETKPENGPHDKDSQTFDKKQERIVDLNRKLFLEAVKASIMSRLIYNGPGLSSSLSQVLGLLLDSETRRRIRISTGESAVSISIEYHSYDITEAILSNRLFCLEDLSTPEILGRVLSTQKPNLLLEMIEAGLDLNVRNSRGENFLHLLSAHGWTTSMVRELLPHIESKVNLEELVHSTDVTLSTPFDKAVLSCQFPLADILFDYGVDIDGWHFSRDLFLTRDTRTLLGRCLRSPDERVRLNQVRYLLGKNPGFQVNRELGSTALMECIKHWKLQRKKYVYPESGEVFTTDLLEMLLKHYSGPDYINRRNYLGITALHVAASSGDLAAVKLLLENGANINAMDNGRQTPLEAVGDELFNLVYSGRTETEIPHKEEVVRLSKTSVEYFVMLQVYKYLEAQGAKPGTQLDEETPIQDNGSEVEAAEKLHRITSLFHLRKRKIEARGNPKASPVVVPPPERPDLGGLMQRFAIPEQMQTLMDSSLEEFERALAKEMGLE